MPESTRLRSTSRLVSRVAAGLLTACAWSSFALALPSFDARPVASAADLHRAPTAPAPFEGFAWPTSAHIRSAGKLRAHPELADALVRTIASADDERASLQRHFAAVLDWLDEQRDASLGLAAARLEQRRGAPLAPAARARLIELLGRRRDRQTAVLAAYAEAGRFPILPDGDTGPVPVFVDAIDTACAVGFLMRVDGRSDDVADIASRTNGVYVPDVASGAVLDWVATSGLTVEEAAVIQPAYNHRPLPAGQVDLVALRESGAMLELVPGTGVFLVGIQAARAPGVASTPLTDEELAEIQLVIYGPEQDECIADDSEYFGDYVGCINQPITGEDEIGLLWHGGGSGGMVSSMVPGGERFLALRYALVSLDPDHLIDGQSLWLLPGQALLGWQTQNFGDVTVESPIELLPSRDWSHLIVGTAGSSFGAPFYAEAIFEPSTVVFNNVYAWGDPYYDGGDYQVESFVQTFHITNVPEPGYTSGALASLATLAWLSRRRAHSAP